MAGEEQGAGAVALPPGLAPAASAEAAVPQIAQLNVSHNSTMHIGPHFVSVTQNVHRDRVVKGRLFGLWLETRGAGEAAGASGATRRLRCSVAVFVCWALLVAAALGVYAARLAVPRPHHIELEGVWRVAWAWARGTSRGERVACAAALAALLLVAAAAAALATRAARPYSDPARQGWNITRVLWLSDKRKADEEPWPARFLPLRLVLVQHTAGAECDTLAACATVMRNMQKYYFKHKGYDVPYNFVVGNDARVYEGRGAAFVGAHTRGYNRCSLGLAFTGNYRNASGGAVPSTAQLAAARELLAAGVRAGWLHAHPVLLAARDVQSTASPGDRLYAALRRWPEAPPDPSRFRDRSCDVIYADLEALDAESAASGTTLDSMLPPSSTTRTPDAASPTSSVEPVADLDPASPTPSPTPPNALGSTAPRPFITRQLLDFAAATPSSSQSPAPKFDDEPTAATPS